MIAEMHEAERVSAEEFERRYERAYADLAAGRYFFDSVHTPSVFWVDISKLDLKAGSPALKLDLSNNRILSGETSGEFKPAEPFKFLAPQS